MSAARRLRGFARQQTHRRQDDHERRVPDPESDREAEFDAAVNSVAKKFGDRLNFKYTGPWPPYNFVNIRLKLERGGQA